MELELSRRTMSEAGYASSVYFAYIDMGSHFQAGDQLTENINLVLQRRVKQYRSAQHWQGGVSAASLNIGDQHPGHHTPPNHLTDASNV